jgi:hypothetical protein
MLVRILYATEETFTSTGDVGDAQGRTGCFGQG